MNKNIEIVFVIADAKLQNSAGDHFRQLNRALNIAVTFGAFFEAFISFSVWNYKLFTAILFWRGATLTSNSELEACAQHVALHRDCLPRAWSPE